MKSLSGQCWDQRDLPRLPINRSALRFLIPERPVSVVRYYNTRLSAFGVIVFAIVHMWISVIRQFENGRGDKVGFLKERHLHHFPSKISQDPPTFFGDIQSLHIPGKHRNVLSCPLYPGLCHS